uniref:Conserved oligomeric Golgi complex subunit 5 n=1 Tax=Caenorhabditis tropicalis TaxID=1561998 RepID=A0A1I7SZ05_9PELO
MGQTSREVEMGEAINRTRINRKVMEIREFLQDLEESYERVTGVLDASAENYSLLNQRARRAACNNLIRFDAVLDRINRKLSEIEENLATLELAGVEMGTITRAIKTQISSFSRIISGLQMILSLESVPMDETKSMDFTAAKEELFKQINELQLLPERRGVEQRFKILNGRTTPVVGLAMEN